MLLCTDDVELVAETLAERPCIPLAVAILFSVGSKLKGKKFRGDYELD